MEIGIVDGLYMWNDKCRFEISRLIVPSKVGDRPRIIAISINFSYNVKAHT